MQVGSPLIYGLKQQLHLQESRMNQSILILINRLKKKLTIDIYVGLEFGE